MIQALKPALGNNYPLQSPALSQARTSFSSPQPILTQDTVTFRGKFAKAQGRYDAQEIQAFADQVRRDGFCILPGHFPKDKMKNCLEAFLPILHDRIQRGWAADRSNGAQNRFYVTPPFTAPFADPAIIGDPDVLAILEKLFGKDNIAMAELGSDTPLPGSGNQKVHQDADLTSPFLPHDPPEKVFQVGVNTWLVKVTPENGPFEVVRGTQLMPEEEVPRKLDSGELSLEPLMTNVGDVLVRDVRTFHRGTGNKTKEPRPMISIGFNPPAHNRSVLDKPVFIQISEDKLQKLPPKLREIVLKGNPKILKSFAEADFRESYADLDFLKSRK